MATIHGLATKLEILRTNPSHAHRLVLRTQSAVSNGENYFVNAGNPAVLLLESTIAVGCAQMMQAETLMNRIFPSLAVSNEDLYLHMSDSDYLNRFSTPGEAGFNLYFSYDELLIRSVALNDGSGVKLIRIPKHTQITVSNTTFTMQYGVDIRILPQGGISVLYNTDSSSPIESLLTNVPDWDIVMIEGIKLIKMRLVLKQMLINSNIAQLNGVTGFVKEFAFVDNFYYARAYTKNEDDGTWVEIRTTHTDQVYDASNPTVVLKLLDNTLRVYIPQIYFNNLTIKDSLRIDIYTTKGPMILNLANYDTRSFVVQWVDRDSELTSIYSSPLNTISGFMIISQDTVEGGSLGLTFEELRNQIIDDTGKKILPITSKQLFNPRNTLGYDVVLSLDNITDRQYLAAKALPATDNEYTVTSIGCGINTLQTSFTSLIANNNVANNVRRMTIKPNTVFKSVNGVISVVDSALVANWKNPLLTSSEVLANIINSGDYLFTPFYYVLDAAHEEFDIRPYRLDKPQILSKYFVNQNTSLLIDVSTKTYVTSLNPNGNGYLFAIELFASKDWMAMPLDSVFLQLRIVPPNTTTPVYINGILMSQLDTNTGKPVDGRYIYHFHLNTNWDIDENHRLLLTPSQAALDLETEMDLIFVVKNQLPPGALTSDIDGMFDPTLFAGYNTAYVYKGLVNERFTLRFGVYLKYLWNRARSIAESLQYVKYTADIPAIYTQNVYQRDALGNVDLVYNNATSEYEVVLLHSIGDPVLDGDGNPTYAHRKGDTVLDVDGQPVLVNAGRDTLRQMDLLMLDGKYYFSTNDTTVSYRDQIIDTLTNWITDDIVNLNDMLLDLSEMYFYPKQSMGSLEVYITPTELMTIPANHHFRLVYHVKEYISNNVILKDTIRRTTAKVLAECLAQPIVSRSTMIDKLKIALGEDVLSIGLTSNVFSDTGIEAFTIKDNSNLPVVGKQLIALSNQTLAVQDAISINYVALTK